MTDTTAATSASIKIIDPIPVDSDTIRRLVISTPFHAKSTISYGLIVFANDTKRWAVIQRKHSAEFLVVVRGLYRLTHLPLLLACITVEESQLIRECLRIGPDRFWALFLNELGLEQAELQYALVRFSESRAIISSLITKLDVSKNVLKWTWPKGRLHVGSRRESPLECAQREFTEEVEIQLPHPTFISDTYIGETVHTITGRNIESRYWVYVIDHEIPIKPPASHPEVSNRRWVDSTTCARLIGHDQMFKRVTEILAH
jgi:ADP-ribose pyrophosphatase YjhB (NUDIX family)